MNPGAGNDMAEDKPEIKLEGMTIYESVPYKARRNLPLNLDEREFCENRIIQDYSEYISKIEDEVLLQEMDDRGLI